MFNNLMIIIVTYNATPWLYKCLGSIDFDKYKVVVVDNNSQDETVKIIEQNYQQIKLFKEKENLGFGQANNKGVSFALSQGAEHVFLFNQDAYLIDDALDRLIQFQIQYSEYGILSAIHTNADGTRLDRNFSNYVSFNANPAFYSDHVLGRPLQEVYEVPFVNAAGWLISKECLMTVGGFDPIFFHYGEDDNYCQRVLFHDFKIGVLSKTFMIHDREEREKTKIVPYSEAYFKAKERSFKARYANINLDIQEVTQIDKKYKKKILKERVKGNFVFAKHLQREYKVLKSALSEIENSRELNKTAGAHYLDI
jgi:GT2 family glycosyltransferase